MKSDKQLWLPEGFIHGSIPTEEGAGREEEGPENGEPKTRTVGRIRTEHGQGRDQVEDKRERADCMLEKTEKNINKNSKPIRVFTETKQSVKIWFNKNKQHNFKLDFNSPESLVCK